MPRRTKRKVVPRPVHVLPIPAASDDAPPVTVFAHTLKRAHAPAITPLNPIEQAPACWRHAPNWMPWVHVSHRGRRGRRVLIDVRRETMASGASPNQQVTLLEALQALEAFGWRGGDNRAGVAYVLPDLSANPQRPARRAAFFALPNLQQIETREVRWHELLGEERWREVQQRWRNLYAFPPELSAGRKPEDIP